MPLGAGPQARSEVLGLIRRLEELSAPLGGTVARELENFRPLPSPPEEFQQPSQPTAFNAFAVNSAMIPLNARSPSTNKSPSTSPRAMD